MSGVYIAYFTMEAVEGFGDLKIGEQVIVTVKYADDLVLLAKEEAALPNMIEGLMEIVRRYGMEIDGKNTQLMRISR